MTREPSVDCPDEMTTASYLDGTLPAARREAMQAHLAACDACRAGVTLLATAPGAPGAADERVPGEFLAAARGARPVARPARRAAIAWGAIAALIVAGAGLVLLRPWGTTAPAAFRGEAEDPFGDVTPVPGAVVPAAGLVFSWGAVAGADRYDLEVTDPSSRTILSLEVGGGGTSARWPDGAAAPPRGPLIWKVRARALDRVIAEMRPIPFETR